MSLASAAAMVSRTTQTASKIEDKINTLESYLERTGKYNTELGSEVSKYENYLTMCETQLPATLMNITNIESAISINPQSEQNQNLARQLSVLEQKYTQMEQAYKPLMQKVAFLKTQLERSETEEQELLDQKNALKVQYDLAQAGEKDGKTFLDNAIKRLSFTG